MFDCKRREFITLIGGAVAAWPLAARGQQRAFPVVGLLSSRSPAVDTPLLAVIRQGLNETGFVEGQSVALDYRWADGQYDRLAGLAAELVHRQVAVIVTMGGDITALVGQGGYHDNTDRLRGWQRDPVRRDSQSGRARRAHRCGSAYHSGRRTVAGRAAGRPRRLRQTLDLDWSRWRGER